VATYPEGHWGNENHNKDFVAHPFVWGDYVETTCGKYRGLITHAYDKIVCISHEEGTVWWPIKDIQYYKPDHADR